MATTKKEISYGASGNEVKELQTQLNKQGYNLAVDGIFGSKTQSAVKDYQQKNKLAVDGIVGKNTWGSLLGSANNATTTAPSNTTNKTQTTQQNASNNHTQGFQYKDFQASDLVAQANAAIEQHKKTMPNGNKNTYLDNINDTLNKILNRENFSYDVNGDALYQQYKDLYTQQGQMAMMDTMGQAAALTGGYGNSYASTAGNQAYQASLQQLNEVVPELYQLAYQKYQDEGDALAQQYALYSDMDDREKAQEREELSNYYKQLDYLSNEADKLYDREYSQWADRTNLDYGIFTDDRNYNYQVERDAVADQQYKEQFEYQKDRDDIADSRWQQEFDHSTGINNAQLELQKAQLAAELGDTSKLEALGYDTSKYKTETKNNWSNLSADNINETLLSAETPQQLTAMLDLFCEQGLDIALAYELEQTYKRILGFKEDGGNNFESAKNAN